MHSDHLTYIIKDTIDLPYYTNEISQIICTYLDSDLEFKAKAQQVDTLVTGVLSLEQQILARELHLFTIQVPRLSMAAIGMHRLLRVLQLKLPSIIFSTLEEKEPLKTVYLR